MSSEESSLSGISVVIPAYNEEKYLGPCLDAVQRNVLPHVREVLVIDNASTDRTGEVARSYPGVRVIREDRKGLAYARQRGFEESRGDIVAFIDADTRPLPGWITRIAQAFARDANLACISGPYRMYDISVFNQHIARVWDYLGLPLYYVFGYIVIGGNFAIRRKVLTAMGGFDPAIQFYGDDVNVGRQAKKYGTVRFDLHLVMPSSARRMKAEGYGRTLYRYLANYLSIAVAGKVLTGEHADVR